MISVSENINRSISFARPWHRRSGCSSTSARSGMHHCVYASSSQHSQRALKRASRGLSLRSQFPGREIPTASQDQDALMRVPYSFATRSRHIVALCARTPAGSKDPGPVIIITFQPSTPISAFRIILSSTFLCSLLRELVDFTLQFFPLLEKFIFGTLQLSNFVRCCGSDYDFFLLNS